jgi:hypothetical protein
VIQRRPKAAHVYAQADNQWYVEPQWAAALLFAHERFGPTIWDPACGGGNICRAARAAGHEALGSDVVRRAAGRDPWWRGIHDFTSAAPPPVMGRIDIVTNPPFFRARGTEAFIRQALTLATGKVAVFADVKFLAGQRRSGALFAEHCPHRVWIHARRPSCPPGEHLAAGHVAEGGTADWCWLVWDLTAPSTAMFIGGWLREGQESVAANMDDDLFGGPPGPSPAASDAYDDLFG